MYCGLVFFKQETAYEMHISDWSSDVCSSDLVDRPVRQGVNLRLALALPLNVFRIGHRLRRKGPVLDRLALRTDVVAMRRIVMIVRSHLTQPLWFARPAPRPCQFWDRDRHSQSSDCGCRALRGPGPVGLSRKPARKGGGGGKRVA